MLILLSPAKTMNMLPIDSSIDGTVPLFNKDAESLASDMSEFSADQLAALLKTSDAIAQKTFEQYQHFNDSNTPRKQALLAYNGSVFKAIDAQHFSDKEFAYAQDRIRIISTLYGLVRPKDLIKAYRIAFNLRLSEMPGDLYDYWLPRLTHPLLEDAAKVGNVIINLASLDIMAALNQPLIRQHATLITPEFKEHRDGKYEVVRTYAKLARGQMTHYIIKNKIESPEELKGFEWERFKFNAKLSDENIYFFTREKQ